MLRYTNYVTWSDRIYQAKEAFLGGDIISIVLRQSMRLKALLASRRAIGAIKEVDNPVTWIADIPITVIKQEGYNYSSDATQYPIESGAIISDHVILRPLRIDISFEISNMDFNEAGYALDLFEELWMLRVPLELITYHKKIPNMVLVNFQASNTVPEWGKVAGRATFQQVGLCSSTTITGAQREVKPTEKTSGSDVEKSAEPAKDKGVRAPSKSLLKKGSDWLQSVM